MLPAILILAFMGCWAFNSCATYAAFQGNFPRSAEECRRGDAGFAVMFGILTACFLPLGVFVVLCLSGGLEHGLRIPGKPMPHRS